MRKINMTKQQYIKCQKYLKGEIKNTDMYILFNQYNFCNVAIYTD